MTAPQSRVGGALPVGVTHPTPDLAAIEAEWLQQCGSCDAGVTVGCTCPADDPRNVIADLVGEVKRLRGIVNSQKGTPSLRAAQRRARNAEHKAEFLQRRCDRLQSAIEAQGER